MPKQPVTKNTGKGELGSKTPVGLVKERPAETATPVAMAVALLVCKAVGVDDAYTVGYVAIVVSFVPAAVTWLVHTLKS